MARKQNDNNPGRAAPALAASAANPSAEAAAPEPPAHSGVTIFDETRSGRDRRLDSAPVDDPRRKNPDRRAGKKMKGAWWLERDYVESHHFVQTPRGRHHEGDTGG